MNTIINCGRGRPYYVNFYQYDPRIGRELDNFQGYRVFADTMQSAKDQARQRMASMAESMNRSINGDLIWVVLMDYDKETLLMVESMRVEK